MIAAVVLAAGASSRMGQQKLLLPYGGSTVIAHIVDQLLDSAVDHVSVVCGNRGVEVAGALTGRDVRIVWNHAWHEGMLSSVRRGLETAPAEIEHFLIALGDQPSISAALVDRLIQYYLGAAHGVAVPVHGGRRGHPLIFNARYAVEVRSNFDDEGLRGLLRRHSREVVEMTTEDAGVLDDMDYPEDYRRAVAALERRSAPGC